MTTLFLLGSTPKLSLAELQAYVHPSVRRCGDMFAILSDHALEDVSQLQDSLGGTIKILQPLATTISSEDNLLKEIVEHLSNDDNPEFSFTDASSSELISIDSTDIKNALKQHNISSRYLRSTKIGMPAPLLLSKPSRHDLWLVDVDGSLILAETASVQNIDDWTKRDRSKPYADRKRGMLPPKVARMMLNLLGPTQSDVVVYDPFCGTGTVILEAAVLGYQAVGSDIRQETIFGAQKNVDWLCDQYEVSRVPELIIADATQNSLASQLPKIDAIVTEPFLGKPKPKPEELTNIFKGLEKLYYGSFKNWTRLLKQGGKVVITLPAAESGKHSYTMEKLIDKIATLGYTTVSSPIEYARPGAVIKREIYQITYNA